MFLSSKKPMIIFMLGLHLVAWGILENSHYVDSGIIGFMSGWLWDYKGEEGDAKANKGT